MYCRFCKLVKDYDEISDNLFKGLTICKDCEEKVGDLENFKECLEEYEDSEDCEALIWKAIREIRKINKELATKKAERKYVYERLKLIERRMLKIFEINMIKAKIEDDAKRIEGTSEEEYNRKRLM